MPDAGAAPDYPLANLSKADWLETLAGLVEQNGTFTRLGRRHCAAFVSGQSQSTLLVTFESIPGIQALSEAAEPLGWAFAKAYGWSHMLIASDGDTWFRDGAVYDYIDAMTDDGLFDEFDRVVFYGAGPGGYAAAAFSVAAPGSTVVMIQPQATLDPRITEWDGRFTEMRRQNFSDRYGYAPDMIDAAQRAFVLYDPAEALDAMHAALFTKPHVSKLRLPHMGDAIQSSLMNMQVLQPVLSDAARGTLDAARFAELYRARRNFTPYLRRLLQALDARKRKHLALMLTRNVTARMHAPRFRKRQQQLEAALGIAE